MVTAQTIAYVSISIEEAMTLAFLERRGSMRLGNSCKGRIEVEKSTGNSYERKSR
jgi:hypothetical protein